MDETQERLVHLEIRLPLSQRNMFHALLRLQGLSAQDVVGEFVARWIGEQRDERAPLTWERLVAAGAASGRKEGQS